MAVRFECWASCRWCLPRSGRAKLSSPVLVLSCTMALVLLYAGCEERRVSEQTHTLGLLNDVTKVMFVFLVDHPGFVSSLPDDISMGTSLNAIITRQLLDGQYLSEQVLRERGFLGSGANGEGPVLVDSWRRPLVFQIPMRYPAGLVQQVAGRHRLVAPLPVSLWPVEYRGQIQVWSLGPNGIDDHECGDDVLSR